MLSIENLHCETDSSPILKGINLEVKPGEIHAIMGPNGAGKSTLSKVIAGHPSYEVTQGSISFHGEELLELEPEERTAKGVYTSFQYPVEIPGVSNFLFLRTAHNALSKQRGEAELSEEAFKEHVLRCVKLLNMGERFLDRNVNESFSGGEKKRNEILQMAVLNPELMILDETDSGLDIDAMRIVADGVNSLMNNEKGLILITHYQRLLDYIKPDFVHVLADGKLIKSGDASLALELEKRGYDWIAEGVSA
jgi:Fe-S cluster assembly ATP-binding protein